MCWTGEVHTGAGVWTHRHVLHRTSAYRSWSLNASRDHEFYHQYYLLLCQHNRPWWFRIPLSLTNLQGTLILAWLMSSGIVVFRRTRHVRFSFSRTIILRWRRPFLWNLWTTPLLEFDLMQAFVSMQSFVQMKLGSEYLSCLRHVFEREATWWIHTHTTSQTWADVR